MTSRKPLVLIDGQLSELPATDVAPNNVINTASAPTGTSLAWIEDVDGTGEGYLTPLGFSGIGTIYNEQVSLFALNSAGNKFFAQLQRI